MPIVLYTGGLGSGKTFMMTVTGYYMHTVSRAPVYANYAVSYAEKLISYEHLFSLERAIVLIDEAQVLIDSRMFSSNKQRQFTQWSLQTRKAMLTILMTTQRIHQIDKRVRGIVDVVFECAKFGIGGAYRSRVRRFVPVGEDEYLYTGSRSVIHLKQFYQLYDTYQRVTMLKDDGLPSRPVGLPAGGLAIPDKKNNNKKISLNMIGEYHGK